MREVRLLMPEEQADHLHAWALTWATDTGLDQRLRKGLTSIYLGLARARDAEGKATQGRDAPPAPACGRCAFWVRHPDPFVAGEGGGHCRRYPPKYEPGVAFLTFPATSDGAWCGEFRERGGAA